MEKLIRRILYAVFITLLLSGCASLRFSGDADAVARDALVIAEQQRRIAELEHIALDMGATIAELREGIGAVAGGLEYAVGVAIGGAERSRTIAELWGEIDSFVNSVIADHIRLRKLERRASRTHNGDAQGEG